MATRKGSSAREENGVVQLPATFGKFALGKLQNKLPIEVPRKNLKLPAADRLFTMKQIELALTADVGSQKDAKGQGKMVNTELELEFVGDVQNFVVKEHTLKFRISVPKSIDIHDLQRIWDCSGTIECKVLGAVVQQKETLPGVDDEDEDEEDTED